VVLWKNEKQVKMPTIQALDLSCGSMKSTMMYLTTLNEAQRKAVEATQGPVLVLAGAGAGKTKTITHRIRHLIELGVPGRQILAVTFTNKAAKEMRDRVATLLTDVDAHSLPTVTTFHALGVSILRTNAQYFDMPRHFAIFDRNDSIRAVKEAIKAAGFSEKQYEPRTMLSGISKYKGRGVSYQEFAARSDSDYSLRLLEEVWAGYEKVLKREKAFDFDDLLLKTLTLLKTNEQVRTSYQTLWSYIHVDEYQDTNHVQYEIVRILAAKHRNICCVGDLDQNIYSWRGSTVENIMDFEKTFPGAIIILLEQNYRSTKTIVEASNHVIKKNKNRKEKHLFTENEDGEKIALYPAYDEEDEAAFVAQTARALIEAGAEPHAIAVLYRANFQSRALEEAMLAYGVSYRVLGTKFFERKEIKDLLSYVRAALNPESESDIRRTINTPLRGIGTVTVDKLLVSGLDSLSPAIRAKVGQFYDRLSQIREAIVTLKPSEALKKALVLSEIESGFKKEEKEERTENLRELVTLATRKYDNITAEDGELSGIEQLLADAALATDQDELESPTTNANAVTLMTIHAAKGLEFSYVFITGLEDGLFPHERMGNDGVDEEEERRLFYVALTRAMKKVFLSYANVRTVFGSRTVRLPSEFITDLDESFLEVAEPERKREKVIYFDDF
jgi:DNA helicase-2/ATP-dependent DNA helicase PcrA